MVSTPAKVTAYVSFFGFPLVSRHRLHLRRIVNFYPITEGFRLGFAGRAGGLVGDAGCVNRGNNATSQKVGSVG